MWNNPAHKDRVNIFGQEKHFTLERNPTRCWLKVHISIFPFRFIDHVSFRTAPLISARIPVLRDSSKFIIIIMSCFPTSFYVPRFGGSRENLTLERKRRKQKHAIFQKKRYMGGWLVLSFVAKHTVMYCTVQKNDSSSGSYYIAVPTLSYIRYFTSVMHHLNKKKV